MPTEVYKTEYIQTIDNIEIEISPLKLKYLKELMKEFENIDQEDDSLIVVCNCVKIAMKQFYPKLSKNVEDIEDSFDIKTLYKILKISAGIDIENNEPKENSDNKKETVTWESLDLAKLETEVFLLGIWKNFEELELSISIEELMQILSVTRELDYQEKKFLAAVQGIDLDGGKDENGKERGQKEWEDMKARVFSKGATGDSKDILALQGQNAAKAGFGIGMGLAYEKVTG